MKYSVQTLFLEKWVSLFTDNKSFCEGYITAVKDDAPRNAYRIVREDGKITFELEAQTEVSVGMIASYPTPEQYEFAAQRALDKAAAIRKREKKIF